MTEIVTRFTKASLLTQTDGDNQIADVVRTTTANLSLTSAHNRETIVCDGTSLVITAEAVATLEAALDTTTAGDLVGYYVTVVNINSTDATVQPNGSETSFNGSNTPVTLSQYQSITLTYDPTSNGYLLSYIVDTDGTLAANSDTLLASQKAIKTYVDNKISYSGVFSGYSASLLGSGLSFYTNPNQATSSTTSADGFKTRIYVPTGVTIHSLSVSIDSSSTLDAAASIGVAVNGTMSALKISASSAGQFYNTTDKVSVSAGSYINLLIDTTAATSGNIGPTILWTFGIS